MKTVKNKSSKKHRNPILVALRKRHATTTTTMKDKRDALWKELVTEETQSELDDNEETEC